jgi:hypothetical protein
VVLRTLLAELGWSPTQLAGAVNGVLGPGSVARSTVSDWLNQDRLPREPLPTVVAHLISDVLDREVSVAQLWSSRAQPAEFWVPADHGLQLSWAAAGTVGVLDDWLRHAGGSIGMDRRIFLVGQRGHADQRKAQYHCHFRHGGRGGRRHRRNPQPGRR